jgi:hypothetical protein
MVAYNNAIKNNTAFNRDFNTALLAEGTRDFAELRAIVNSEKVMIEKKKELQDILGGSSLASDDTITRPRDLQFQLYLTSIFDLSGFDLSIEEPDFSFSHEGNTYSVAAKRLSSVSKLRARLSEATKQIKRQKRIGLIALSLDRVVWDEKNLDAFVITDKPDTLYEAGKVTLEELLRNNVGKAVFDTQDSHVVGHIFSLTMPAVIPPLLSVGFASSTLFIPFVDETNPIYHHITDIPDRIKWPNTVV